MNNEPIILADGIRGIHAPQVAARSLLSMATHNRWDLAYVDRGDLALVAHTNMTEATDEQAEEATMAWDDVVRNLEARHHGRPWHIVEDGDIFLVPEGYDMEQG